MSAPLPAAYEFENWDVVRVTEWLQRCNFSWQASSYFRSNGISGRRLLEMDDRDIQQLPCLRPNEKSILKESLYNCRRKQGSSVQDRIRMIGNQNQSCQTSGTLPPPRPNKQAYNQRSHNHAATMPTPSRYHETDGFDYNGNRGPSPKQRQSWGHEEYDSAGDESDEFESDSDDDGNYIEPEDANVPETGLVASIKAELERRGTYKQKPTSSLISPASDQRHFHDEPDDIYDTPEGGDDQDQDDLYESPSDGSVSGSGGGIVARPNNTQQSHGHGYGSYDLQQEDEYVEADRGDSSPGRTQFEEPELVYEVTDNPAPPPPKPGRVQNRFPFNPQPQPADETYEIADPQPARPPRVMPSHPAQDSHEAVSNPLLPARPPKHTGRFPPVPPPQEDQTYEIADHVPPPARPLKSVHRPPPQPEEETYEITDQPQKPVRPSNFPPQRNFSPPQPAADDTYEIADQSPQPARPPKENFRSQPAVLDDTYEIADHNQQPSQRTRSIRDRWPPTPQHVETTPVKPVRPLKPGRLPHTPDQNSRPLPQPVQPPRPPKNNLPQVKKPPPQMIEEDNYEIADSKPATDDTYEIANNESNAQQASQPSQHQKQKPEESFIPQDTGRFEDTYDLPDFKEIKKELPVLPSRPPGNKGPPPVPPQSPGQTAGIQQFELPTPPGKTEGEQPILSLDELQSIKLKRNNSATKRPLPTRPPSQAHITPPAQVNASSDELKNAPYFQGNLDRRKAEESLASYGKDGSFLVRDGRKAPYSMSLYYRGEVKHLQIPFENGKYKLGTSAIQEFDSVIDIVNYHRAHPVVLASGGKTLLTQHCPVYR